MTTARVNRATTESASTRSTATSVCVNPDTQVSQSSICVCVNRWPAKCRACVSDNRYDLVQRLPFPNGTHTHTGVLYINATARMITRLTLCMLHLRRRYKRPCYTLNIGQQQEDFHNLAQHQVPYCSYLTYYKNIRTQFKTELYFI